MEQREWRTMDKSAWGHGPWQDEPDKAQWTDAATGLPCLIVRNSVGSLCGYVGVKKGHRYFEVGYDDCDLEAHGGLTFSSTCADLSQEAWERDRARLPELKAEAARFPSGDAAKYLRDLAPVIDSYEAWRGHEEARSICHIVPPGEPDKVWWLGFDTAHLGDYSPGMSRHRAYEHETYKDLAYVKAEVARLAKQVLEAK